MIETTGIKGGNGRKDVGYHWCVTCNCSAGKKKVLSFFFLFLLPRGLRQPVRSSRWLADVEVNIPHAFCHRRSNQRSTLTRVFRPLTPPRTARSTKILKFREFRLFSKLNFKFNKNLSHSTCQKIKILPKKTGRLLETLNKLARRALC